MNGVEQYIGKISTISENRGLAASPHCDRLFKTKNNDIGRVRAEESLGMTLKAQNLNHMRSSCR